MRDMRRFHGRQVVVQLSDGAISGHLDLAGRETLTLIGAVRIELVGGAQVEREMDGEVVLPASEIRWVQVV